MGTMKSIATAIAEAQDLGLIPTLPQKLYLLMQHNTPIGVYLHHDVALYDAWLCTQSGEDDYHVIEMPFYTESEGDLRCQE
jgi:hypothetical protein